METGKIILNGVSYSGIDVSNEASDISYDNTESGLEATNVQDAIDELNTGLSKITKPFYNGAQTIENEKVYTIPKNGFLLTSIYHSNSNTFFIRVNGNDVFSHTADSSGVASFIGITLPVGENDTVMCTFNTYGAHSGGLKFIPYTDGE